MRISLNFGLNRNLGNIGTFQNGTVLTTTVNGTNELIPVAKITLTPGIYIVSISCTWATGFPDFVAYVLDGTTIRGTGLNGGGVSITRIYQQSNTKDVIFSVIQNSGEVKTLNNFIFQSARIK